jgi:hypothetical protein
VDSSSFMKLVRRRVVHSSSFMKFLRGRDVDTESFMKLVTMSEHHYQHLFILKI